MIRNETSEFEVSGDKLLTSFKRDTEVTMGFIFLFFSIIGKLWERF